MKKKIMINYQIMIRDIKCDKEFPNGRKTQLGDYEIKQNEKLLQMLKIYNFDNNLNKEIIDQNMDYF